MNNDKIDRVVQAFNLVTGKELNRKDGELFAQLLTVARGELTYPVEQVLAVTPGCPVAEWRAGDRICYLGGLSGGAWSTGKVYKVLGVEADRVRVSNDGARPTWFPSDRVDECFGWVSRASEGLTPAALPPEQWLTGDIIRFIGAHLAHFSAGVDYKILERTEGHVCVAGLRGFSGVWDLKSAQRDWVWVSRP